MNKFRKHPRGSAYAMVLAISMLVSVIGVAALTAVRVQIRSAANTNDCDEARLYAQSGLELARCWIYADPNWRTNRTSGSTASMSFGAGSFSVTFVDPVDNDFTNSPLDPVKITAIGYKGSAQQQVQATLKPAPTAFTCLNAAVTVASTLSLTSGTLTTGGIVASNANMSVASNAGLDATAEAAGTFSGTSYFGSKTSGVTARNMPDSTAFDYYKTNGTAIAYASLTGAGDFHDLLLSASNNPYGSTNVNGIYVIDCGGNTIHIHNCRVVGTLVILNCKSDSKVDGEVNLAPAVTNYPCLMVQGSMAFNFDGNTLNEGTGKNFNPPGTPYNGVSNSTTTDTYPSIINGLTYVSGSVTGNAASAFGGPLIVGGTLAFSQSVSGKYDATYFNNPPPGFFTNPPMKVSASSWAQTVN